MRGPLFRYANLFTEILGASSYELLARDFTQALENEEVQAIVLDIDSPGGEVNGCAELASMVYKGRGIKPIIAYASGDACSGAYWIASACDEVLVSPTSELGSIGIVGVWGQCGDDNDIEIVSSQSPHKHPDPKTEEGKARLQTRIDALGQVFVEAVAKYRSVGTDIVLKDYGGGDVLVGKAAVRVGLADGLGNFEEIISQYQQRKEEDMKKTEDAVPTAKVEEITSEAKALGKQEECVRIGGILGSEEAKGRGALASHLAFKTKMSPQEAIAVLSKAPQPSKGFVAAMEGVQNPSITPREEEETEETMAKRIATIGG